ncbi:MAG: hypothetical protein HYV41_04415 [Candidatus Magasanikbacteria bacterium]|nr:hypothetical protein [Candidatus Magasanikbacteria bacterium]
MLERFNPFHKSQQQEMPQASLESHETSRWTRLAKKFAGLLVAAGIMGGASQSAEAKQQPHAEQADQIASAFKETVGNLGSSPAEFAQKLQAQMKGTSFKPNEADVLQYASVMNKDGTKTPLGEVDKKFDTTKGDNGKSREITGRGKLSDRRVANVADEMATIRELSPKVEEENVDAKLDQAVKAGSINAINATTTEAQIILAETMGTDSEERKRERIKGTDSGVTQNPTIASYSTKGYEANQLIDLATVPNVAAQKTMEVLRDAVTKIETNNTKNVPLINEQIEALKETANPDKTSNEPTLEYSAGTKRILADLQKSVANLFEKKGKLPTSTREFLENLDASLEKATETDYQVKKENLKQMKKTLENLASSSDIPDDVKKNADLFLNSLRVLSINPSDTALRVLYERLKKLQPYLDITFAEPNLNLKNVDDVDTVRPMVTRNTETKAQRELRINTLREKLGLNKPQGGKPLTPIKTAKNPPHNVTQK